MLERLVASSSDEFTDEITSSFGEAYWDHKCKKSKWSHDCLGWENISWEITANEGEDVESPPTPAPHEETTKASVNLLTKVGESFLIEEPYLWVLFPVINESGNVDIADYVPDYELKWWSQEKSFPHHVFVEDKEPCKE